MAASVSLAGMMWVPGGAQTATASPLRVIRTESCWMWYLASSAKILPVRFGMLVRFP